jgi:hypothetical protein
VNLLAIPGSDKDAKNVYASYSKNLKISHVSWTDGTATLNNNGLVIYLIIQTNLHKIYNLKLYKIKKENKENYNYVYIISAIF